MQLHLLLQFPAHLDDFLARDGRFLPKRVVTVLHAACNEQRVVIRRFDVAVAEAQQVGFLPMAQLVRDVLLQRLVFAPPREGAAIPRVVAAGQPNFVPIVHRCAARQRAQQVDAKLVAPHS